MENCNESCCDGNRQEKSETVTICPVCKEEGVPVSSITVQHLVKEQYEKSIEESGYRLCMEEDCQVAYYNRKNDHKIFIEQVRLPLWFKKNANPKYACYCAKVTEEQVIEAVRVNGAKTVKEVNDITGAMRDSN